MEEVLGALQVLPLLPPTHFSPDVINFRNVPLLIGIIT